MKKFLTSISAVVVLAVASLLGQSNVKTPITNGYIQGSDLDYKGFKGVNAAPGVAGSDLATVSQLGGGGGGGGGVPTTRILTIGGTAFDLSADRAWLGNVTNDTQTKASIVPNSAPSSGQILVGNGGGTAFAPVTLSGSGATFTLNNSGVLTISSIPNASLTNSSITIAGTPTSLGGSITFDTIVPNSSITYAKIQNVSASNKLLGSGAAGGGIAPVEITLGTNLSMSGTTLNATGGSGSPGGSNTQVQYNNSGAFNGITNATTDGTTMALTSPKVTTGINDTNGNPMFVFSATASAVDGFSFTNASTANPATITLAPNGSDANINIGLNAKGSGKIVTNAVVNATTGFEIGGAAVSGKILIGDGTNFIASTPAYPNTSVTSGKILVSDGANYVSSTPTFPNASATSGKKIQSDGTNWVASTATWPTTVTSGKIVYADGTNYVMSTPTFPASASATSGKVIKSDGTNWVASTETYAAPSTAGNLMTSDGTNWTSAAPAGGGGLLAYAGSLTSVTTINNTQTDTTGGVTLANQTAASGSVWRIRAQGIYTAANNAVARNAQWTAYWGSTALVQGSFTVPTNAANTFQFQIDCYLSGSSTTAIWDAMFLSAFNTLNSVPKFTRSAPASTSVTSGAQTIDMRFSMSASGPADVWTIDFVTIERLQ